MTNTTHRDRQAIPIVRPLGLRLAAEMEGPPDRLDMLVIASLMMGGGHYAEALNIAMRMRDDARARGDEMSGQPTHGIWCGFIVAARGATYGWR
jgi:hypothetical protein